MNETTKYTVVEGSVVRVGYGPGVLGPFPGTEVRSFWACASQEEAEAMAEKMNGGWVPGPEFYE